jgi:hypothetical protein
MDMIAKRPMTYATRRLRAGDAFSASNANGRVLAAIGKAEIVSGPSEAGGSDAEQLSDLRTQYQQKFDKKAYHGWDVDTIKNKIAEAKD